DEHPEHDPRRPQLPEDRRVRGRQARMHVHEGEVRRRRLGDGADTEMDRPDHEAGRERDGDEERPEGDRGGRPRHPFAAALSVAATIRTKSTTRGPQREAMSSLTATMS